MANAEIAILDIETSGLNERENIILEIGIVLLTRSLEIVGKFESVVADPMAVQHLDWLEQMASQEPNFRGQQPWAGAKYVHEMHQANGLAMEIRAKVQGGDIHSLAEVSHSAADWLRSFNIGRDLTALPMTGSSVHFDRGFIKEQMPVLNEQFHYRNIDISSVKGLVDLYRADIVELRKTELRPDCSHRAMRDCLDSIDELRFYLENVFSKGATNV